MDGQVIRIARIAAGVTQLEFAKRLGVSRPYVSLVEHGRKPVTEKFEREARVILGLSDGKVKRIIEIQKEEGCSWS